MLQQILAFRIMWPLLYGKEATGHSLGERGQPAVSGPYEHRGQGVGEGEVLCLPLEPEQLFPHEDSRTRILVYTHLCMLKPFLPKPDQVPPPSRGLPLPSVPVCMCCRKPLIKRRVLKYCNELASYLYSAFK